MYPQMKLGGRGLHYQLDLTTLKTQHKKVSAQSIKNWLSYDFEGNQIYPKLSRKVGVRVYTNY